MLSLAFPPVDLGWLAFVALVPLVYVFREAGRRRTGVAAAAFGVSFFGLLLSWIRLFGPEAYVALVVAQTAWVVVALLAGKAATRRLGGAAGVLAFPLAFLAGEYLRGNFPLGGFTWGGLGYSQHENVRVLRLASYTGVWGVTLLVAFVNAAVVEAAFHLRRRSARAGAFAASAALVLAVASVLPVGAPDGRAARVGIVQGNAPEGLDDPSADDVEVFVNHLRLTKAVPRDASLVVWPESALDTGTLSNPRIARALEVTIRETGKPFLVGAYLEEPRDRFRNASLFFTADGAPAGEYVKRHLVPFGEYIPYRKVLVPLLGPLIEQLELVPRDGIPGREATVFDLPEGRFASVICFESTFPGLVRSSVRAGARMLVVSTNNSSFLRTAASAQHVAFSQLRAAEHRMWVAHAALTGISAVVAPDGSVVEETGLFEEAVLAPEVRFATRTTPYARFGDWLPLWTLGLMSILLLIGVPRARRKVEAAPAAAERKVLVIVPTYDEAGNIAALVDAVLGAVPRATLLVVDDASPDGTADAVRRKARLDDRIHLLARERKLGLGRAYVAGFAWGLERGFGLLIEMDADFSHDPSDLPRLVAAAAEADLVIGSRYAGGGRVEGWSFARHLISRAGNVYARLLLGFPIRDSTSGFRCFSREALESIPLSSIGSEGYAFQIDMAYRAWRLGFRVDELPIVFRERRGGGSKLSRAIILEAILRMTAWGLRDLLLGRRFRALGTRGGRS